MPGKEPEPQKRNRRRRKRSKSPVARQAAISIGGHPYQGDLLDYSFSGFGIQVGSSVLTGAAQRHSEVELKIGNQRFLGNITNTRTQNSLGVLGIALKSDTQEGPVSFTNDDGGWDLLDDPETLNALFSDVVTHGPRCPIEFQQGNSQGVLYPEQLDSELLVARVESAGTSPIAQGLASFRLEIFQTCHAFDAEIASVDANVIQVKLPARVARLLRRETVRVQNNTSGQSLAIQAQSGLLGTSHASVRVYDYSEHGISIIDPTGQYAGPVGTKIESILISTQDDLQIRGSGVIASQKWVEEEKGHAIGISFETSTSEDRTRWHNTILAGRYPALSFSYETADHNQVWDLFERSGYLEEKPRETFSHVLDVTKGTWSKLYEAGTQLSKRALIKKDGVTVGHLQMDRIYPETWCAHHLAIDPKVSRLVGREIYALTADVLSGEGASYVFSFADAKKAWNQRNYYDFIKQYRYPEHNELQIFQMYEFERGTPTNFETLPNLSIKKANQFDLRRVERFCELYLTPLERRACALTGDGLELSTLDSELNQYGLKRNREFLVGALDGNFAGFARIERSSPGTNIFGLFDIIYIHVMPDFSNLEHQIRSSLISAALKRFEETDGHAILLALNDERREYYQERGLKYLTEGARWIADCAVTRRYHAYSQMLYGHLLLRRESIRMRQKK